MGQEPSSEQGFYYEEKIDDAYLAPSNSTKNKSKAFELISDNFFCTQVNIDPNGENLMNDAANEPSIAINPSNPNEMIIGWRQFDNINSNFRQAGYGYTTDGGLTWKSPEPIEQGVFRSDPVLGTDGEGRFYYNSLSFEESSGDIFCHTFISNEIGQWDEGTYAFGGDKQWMAIGESSSKDPRIYLTWSPSFSICEGSFTQSLDGGTNYEECEDAQFDSFLGTINVGRDNNLYAAGWNRNNVTVRISDSIEDSLVWQRSRTVNLEGTLASRQGPNPAGLLGQVDIETDIQNMANENYIYVLSSVVPIQSEDPCDLMFTRSINGGLTFEDPIRINTDISTENYQWFGTMSVAPNGRIDVVWLDTRDNPGTFMSALYYSFSTDHGVTWSENQKLTEPFDPQVGWPNQPKMGDYFDMKSSDDGAHLAWCGTFNGEQDVFYSFIRPEEVTTAIDNVLPLEKMADVKVMPNPSRALPSLEISSLLRVDLDIQLTNVQGTVIGRGLIQNQGHQEVSLHDIIQLSNPLNTGIYFLHLSSKRHGHTVKRIVIY